MTNIGGTVNSTTLVLLVLIVGVMAYRLKDLYLGGHYVCPSCGTRRDDRHASECQWHR
jgi:hypothetical protein